MIGYLEGKVIAVGRSSVVVLTTGGVGYAVAIGDKLAIGNSQLAIGNEVALFIHTHVREQAIELYGFLTQEDLAVFEQLISVSGVGPKTALAILAQGDSKAVSAAISRADVGFFQAAKGVGKKAAQKIIVELKGKVGAGDADLGTFDVVDDLTVALLEMGFGESEVRSLVGQIDRNKALEEQVVEALRKLGR